MKKTLFLLILFNTLFCVAQSAQYSTSSTGSSNYNKWTKIASVTLSSQYSNSNSTILLSGGSSSSSVTSSKLFFRVKQQSALPGSPYIQLELIQTNNTRLTNNDIKAITTTLNASQSIVDLYIRITNSWEIIVFTPIFTNNTSPSFYSNQDFSTSLPVGLQTDCKYPNNYFDQGIFENNVGIGTTTPDAKLTVKGNIHTNEVKVDLLGAVAPDYVFYKDYILKSLKNIEDYITTEGHLPNIPSAKTMETEGINLKEMNLKLLEKIEELTLYTIQQEKEITSLKAKATKVYTLEQEFQNQKLINKSLEERLQNIESLLNSKKQ